MNGSKEGEGVYYYMNGNTYKGSWKKDKKHGYGEYKYYLTGERYEGEWINGDKKGQGTFEFSFG